jgi:hypothetical protein
MTSARSVALKYRATMDLSKPATLAALAPRGKGQGQGKSQTKLKAKPAKGGETRDRTQSGGGQNSDTTAKVQDTERQKHASAPVSSEATKGSGSKGKKSGTPMGTQPFKTPGPTQTKPTPGARGAQDSAKRASEKKGKRATAKGDTGLLPLANVPPQPATGAIAKSQITTHDPSLGPAPATPRLSPLPMGGRT